jgi:hypothetical protein
VPRRPKGGPDGARDIQALFRNSIEVWGAIGFQNSANDSPANKSWVKKKFKADLKEALKQNPQLKGFVFFTNVDLTPSEQKALQSHAMNCGIVHCDVFFRERLRQVLDSNEGFGYRVQYLKIPMSIEEQVAFIETLQANRAKEVAEYKHQQEQIVRDTQHLKFRAECLRPVHEIGFGIHFKQPYTPEEIGHFRILAEIARIYDPFPYPSLFIGGRDSYATHAADGKPRQLFGIHCVSWQTEPECQLHSRSEVFNSDDKTTFAYFRVPLNRRGPYKVVGDFDRTLVNMYLSRSLLDKIVVILFTVNGFALHVVERHGMATFDQVGRLEDNDPPFPIELTDSEKAIPWRRIYLRTPETDDPNAHPMMRAYANELHFDMIRPWRVNMPNATGGSLEASAAFIFR